jgi:uncharacterized protein YkwD
MGRLTIAVVILGIILLNLALPRQVGGQWPGPGRAYRGPEARSLQELAWGIFWLTNEQRRRQGLAPLAWDESLAAAARAHSSDMLQRRFFSHVTPEGRSLQGRLAPGYVRAGENIWSGSGHNYPDSWGLARAIVDAWLASPGHRANMLDPHYSHLGVGIAGRGGELRATQDFVQGRQSSGF